MSLLQLLAQSLKGQESTTPSTGSTTTASSTTAPSDKPRDDSAGATPADPNAPTLALTQALAAALGASTAVPAGTVSNTSPAAADSTSGSVTDATKSPNSSSMQDLVLLLANDIAADGKARSAANAAQSANAGQLDLATTKPSSSDATGAGAASDTSTAAAAGSNSLAQLGAAAHFSLQHTQTDAHPGGLNSRLGSAAWQDELGGQLTWMTQKGLESGSLRVTPEHLGPVEVRISVQNGAASVWFGASHPDTRAALEQALPRLREMFANQGLTLSDSGVSRESPRNQGRPASPQGVGAVSAIGSAELASSSTVRASLGLVDTYA